MNLERDLRRTLHDERHALPAWPDAVVRVRAGIARRRRRRAIVAALVAALIVALAIPAGLRMNAAPPQPANPAPSPGIIPWLAAPATVPEWTPPEVSARAPARMCEPSQLSSPTLAGVEGAGGHTQTTVAVKNHGPNRCTLSGSATVIATDVTTGHRARLATRSGTYFDAAPKQYPATIDHDELAYLDVATAMGCRGGLDPTRYRGIVLGYGGREHRLTDVTLETTCAVEVGAWYRLPPDILPPPPRYSRVVVTLTTAGPYQRGADAEFVVTLANPTAEPIALDPCPVYTMYLQKNIATHRLNCAVGEVPPNGALRFAMRLPVSAETSVGPGVLHWEIIELGQQASAAADAQVQVE